MDADCPEEQQTIAHNVETILTVATQRCMGGTIGQSPEKRWSGGAFFIGQGERDMVPRLERDAEYEDAI